MIAISPAMDGEPDRISQKKGCTMKKSALVMMVALIALTFGIVGVAKECSTPASETAEQQAMGVCPVCGTKAPVGTYCPECKAVAVAKVKTFICPKCKKEVKEGTWCAKHNCFRFENPEMKCPKSGKTVKKGAYCEKCNGYHGLKMVKYDAEKKLPYAVEE